MLWEAKNFKNTITIFSCLNYPLPPYNRLEIVQGIIGPAMVKPTESPALLTPPSTDGLTSR